MIDPSPRPDPRDRIVERGREILRLEADAILHKAERLDASFDRLIQRILALDGRVAVTGVGKSGIIGEKLSATLSSTGTPSLFLRPVEALHGDLGMLRQGDLLIALSNSGETAEVLAVSSAAREALEVETVAFTGAPTSSLARMAILTIDTSVEREACPLGLAPTSSTTTALAIGDALAMVLLEERGFTREHYARFHPGGSLGERLRYKVRDFLRSGELLPSVPEDAPLALALDEMTRRDNIGLTLVVAATGELSGILTDGDLRRIISGHAFGPRGGAATLLELQVREVMTRHPRTIEASASAREALQVMEVHGITSLAVVDHAGRPEGLIHLHDILGRGKIVL